MALAAQLVQELSRRGAVFKSNSLRSCPQLRAVFGDDHASWPSASWPIA